MHDQSIPQRGWTDFRARCDRWGLATTLTLAALGPLVYWLWQGTSEAKTHVAEWILTLVIPPVVLVVLALVVSFLRAPVLLSNERLADLRTVRAQLAERDDRAAFIGDLGEAMDRGNLILGLVRYKPWDDPEADEYHPDFDRADEWELETYNLLRRRSSEYAAHFRLDAGLPEEIQPDSEARLTRGREAERTMKRRLIRLQELIEWACSPQGRGPT